ncbi:hypothetical protein BDV98DRAFT_597322 [Pterulicium gracile]|uniref:Homeobox domain-containing protein n=1 Tax=Pterulicium gracile TaxID=1884261 RepID=A0A5C3Q6Y1_9AGAR|nr:hypothetical protein BDV98DRAFT_597322 [Pterula gracilis]
MAYLPTTPLRTQTRLISPLHSASPPPKQRFNDDSLLYTSDQDSSSSNTPASKRALRRTYEPEKRKRCRVTPEQLTHLENFFASERSPSAYRRREISEFLGMNDRQTQIWFQNRRAKEKQLLGKRKAATSVERSSSHGVADVLETESVINIISVVHEDGPITLIPCTDITIGTWRRVSTSSLDLVAYRNDGRRCLAWYIRSAGYGFKMEIPFGFITEMDLVPSPSGLAVLVVTLSRAPLFFMEAADATAHGGAAGRVWSQCSDWTEGHQASSKLRHELLGSYGQLSQVAADLRVDILSGHDAAHREIQVPVPINITPPTVAVMPSSTPSSPSDGLSVSPTPSIGPYHHTQPDSNDLYPFSHPTLHTQPQKHTKPNLVLALDTTGNAPPHSYPSARHRASAGLRNSSAPPNPPPFFRADTADSVVPHAAVYETHRRHSSHIPAYSWPSSPCSPPPSIAIRRGTPDSYQDYHLTTNGMDIYNRSSSQPQFLSHSGFDVTSRADERMPLPVLYQPISPTYASDSDFSEAGPIDGRSLSDSDTLPSAQRQGLLAHRHASISNLAPSSTDSSEVDVVHHHSDSCNDHSHPSYSPVHYVYSPQPFFGDMDASAMGAAALSYYASPVPLTPPEGEYAAESPYPSGMSIALIPDPSEQWLNHYHSGQQ